MTEESIDEIKVNGRSYRKPTARTIVICFDGCDPRYISHGLSAGLLPNISKVVSEGFFAIADAVMPTFAESKQHVDCHRGAPQGAWHLWQLLSRQSHRPGGDDHRCLARLLGHGSWPALADAGVRVAAITAKDKLREMLGSGLKGKFVFPPSARARRRCRETGSTRVERLVGRPTPDMYSPDLSLFVLDAEVGSWKRVAQTSSICRCRTWSSIAPDPVRNWRTHSNREVDKRVGRMLELDAVVAIVADHGMTDKCTSRWPAAGSLSWNRRSTISSIRARCA